jgi:hypothetical protein
MRIELADGKPLASDGHTLKFLANTGKMMRGINLAVDLDTLSVPLIDGSLKLLNDIEPSDQIAVPLLADHYPSISAQAGTITALSHEDSGMEATAKLSDTEAGLTVQQLAKDGVLTNSFSIHVDFTTEPGADNTIHDAELVEISVVYKGQDQAAHFHSINSRKGNAMQIKTTLDTSAIESRMSEFKLSDEEKKNLTDTVTETMQSALDDVVKAIGDESEDSGNDDNGGDDSDKADGAPEGAQQSAKEEKEGGKLARTVIINSSNKAVSGGAVSLSKSQPKSYLDTEKAVLDYAEYLQKHPSEDAMTVNEGWQQKAKLELAKSASFGIDGDDAKKFIPKAVLTAVEDAFNAPGRIWPMLNHTGLDVPPELGLNDVSLDNDNGRAHGYRPEEYGTEKKEQHIAIQTRTGDANYTYKYQKIDKGWLRKTQDPGALLKYVLQELPNRIIQTIERAAIINSVAPTATNDWPDLDYFRSIYDDSLETAATAGARVIPGNTFALTMTQKQNDTYFDAVVAASRKIRAQGKKVLVTSSDRLGDIEASKDVDGRYIIAPGSSTETALRVDEIITPEWWFARDDAKALGIVFVPGAYDVYGDNSIEAYTNFALRTNQNEYLQEIYAGGLLTKQKSAVVIKPFNA